MRKILYFLLLIVTSCGTQKQSGKPNLTVSIYPQKYFVEKIAGDFADVDVLVPTGASPATYELLPSQMKALSESAAWFRIGHIPFEHSWYHKIKQANSKLKIYDTSLNADLIAGEEIDHGDHVHLNGIDPHIWMSPREVKKIAQLTLDGLVELFPKMKETFITNHETFQLEIDEIDKKMVEKFKEIGNRKFLIFHPSFTYLARDYDLEQITLEVQGKHPSPKHMSELIDMAKANNLKAIFIQKEFDRTNADQLAKEIGAQVVQLDPLTENWGTQILVIADKIVEVSK